MNILVYGQGGREHALVKALKNSPRVSQLYCTPGSDAIAQLAQVFPHQNKNDLIQKMKEHKIDLVVIGPEVPLAEGLSDELRNEGFLVFGPSQKGAQLEASKIFSKEFLNSAGIPTAMSQVVSSVKETLVAAQTFSPPWVLKADGLAAGKGVAICATPADLENTARSFFEDKTLGSAGHSAILEEFLEGYELSYLVLTNGKQFEPLPIAQDHKRLLDNDQGPNTGGMGTMAPISISSSDLNLIHQRIVEPTLAELQNRDLDYRGVIFIGLMMTTRGPYALEYNVRFGDPETQVILPLLDGDWADVFESVAKGEVPKLKWKPLFATCVVIAAQGYPEKPVTQSFQILTEDKPEQYVLHAGTKKLNAANWESKGGRVLNCIGVSKTREEARRKSYELVEKLNWPSSQYRKDIGKIEN